MQTRLHNVVKRFICDKCTPNYPHIAVDEHDSWRRLRRKSNVFVAESLLCVRIFIKRLMMHCSVHRTLLLWPFITCWYLQVLCARIEGHERREGRIHISIFYYVKEKNTHGLIGHVIFFSLNCWNYNDFIIILIHTESTKSPKKWRTVRQRWVENIAPKRNVNTSCVCRHLCDTEFITTMKLS